LLEVLVATAIMAIAVIGLLSLISGSLANAARVQEYDRAAMLARHKMGELMVSEPLSLNADLSGDFDEASGWKARVEPFESLPGSGQAILAQIHLEIWWRSEGRRRTVAFDSYRRLVRPPERPIAP
jgi:hypothetical protein